LFDFGSFQSGKSNNLKEFERECACVFDTIVWLLISLSQGHFLIGFDDRRKFFVVLSVIFWRDLNKYDDVVV